MGSLNVKRYIVLTLLFLILVLVLPTVGCLSDAARHYNTGVELQGEGRLEEALAEYNEAIRLDSKLSGTYHNRGIVYDELGEYDKAIADYTKAIEIDPNHAEAYFRRGLSYGLTRELAKMVSDFENAIELSNDPEFVANVHDLLDELR